MLANYHDIIGALQNNITIGTPLVIQHVGLTGGQCNFVGALSRQSYLHRTN